MTSNKPRGKRLPLASAIAAAGAFVMSSQSFAQLEEVVVTAQKRSESAQEVPIAITAVSEMALQKSGITGSDELSMVVPNLQFSRQLGSATPFIRGVGTKNSSAGEESSVSTYVDGVYYSSMIASVMEFNNIERIEVLRGPQGTLFGRNATGGLIHVITKDPQFETAGKLKAGYGSYDTYNLGAYATTGLSERVAGDISLLYSKRNDGYGDNKFNDEERPGAEDRSLRGKLLFDMSEKTSILASAMYASRDSDVGIARQPAKGTTATGGGTYNGDFHDINSDWTPMVEADQRAYTLKVTHQFDGAELIATSGYADVSSFILLDQDSGPAHFVNFLVNEKNEQFSQEFQLSSTGAGALQWTTGLFYMSSLAKNAPTRTTSSVAPSFNVTMDTEQETKSYAVYGQLAYDITDATKVTLGARWTLDEREFSGRTTFTGSGDPVNPAMPYLNDDESWEEPTWRLGLDHQVNDEVLLYAYHARGFKSGVYNTLTNNGLLPEPVDPEILDAYEVGIKGDFLDNSLRINAAVFYYEFENLQLQQIDAGAINLFNVGDSEMQGAEIETTYFVTADLDLNFSFAYLDTEYTEFPEGPIIAPDTSDGVGNVSSFGDLAGNEMTRAPEFTYNISANYRMQTSAGELSYNIAYYYNDGFFWEPDNRTEQDSYDVLNAEIALTSKDESWRVRVYGRNLLDSEYSYYSQQSSFGDFVSAAPPMTFGVEVEYRF